MTVSIEGVKKFLEGDQSHFSRHIGLKITSYSTEKIEGEITTEPHHSNRAGLMHGGAIMTMADTMGGVGTTANLPEGSATVTIESKTNFFSGIPIGDTARAECTPLHRGRTTMVWQTRITRGDGKLAAIVTQTQLVIAPGERPTGGKK
jgi:1,4-dihydroxy-2-naphthoyl-CoA hydrolase